MSEKKHISRVVPGDRVRNIETGVEGIVAGTDPGCAQLRLVDDHTADPTAYRPNDRARETSQQPMHSWSLFEHVPDLSEVEKSALAVEAALKARQDAHAAADVAYDKHAQLADAHAKLVESAKAAEAPVATQTEPELPVGAS